MLPGKTIHETTRSIQSLFVRFRVPSWIVLVVIALQCQPALAQQTKKLPAAEKIVDNYLKAIGGKKQASSIRDATYDWTIQSKAPASQRSELTIGNEQTISAATPRSAWVRRSDGELRTLTGPEAAAA